MAVYTFEALTSGVEAQAPGREGGGGGGAGSGEGAGGGVGGEGGGEGGGGEGWTHGPHTPHRCQVHLVAQVLPGWVQGWG